MEPEEDIIAAICGACAKTNCMNLCSKLRATISNGGGDGMSVFDTPKIVTPARRGRMGAWEKRLRDEAYSARGEDTPEKIEWFRQGIARRRQELFSMNFAMQAYE